MARLPRLCAPGYAHHLLQRGNNRQPTFHDAKDYERLLELLTEHAAREKVAVHAYVLLSNHFHLLATPETAMGLPRLMQALGRRYVQYFNRRHGRSGTLWEGRYKAAPIEAERHLLACMVYLDLHPVRAQLAARAEDYRWSSHAHYVGSRTDRLLTPHPLFWQLGNTPFEREAAYAQLVGQGIALDRQSAFTDSVTKAWALGEPAFISALEERTRRRARPGRRGRPPACDHCKKKRNLSVD